MVGIEPSRCKKAGRNPNQREAGLVTFAGVVVSAGECSAARTSGAHRSCVGGGIVCDSVRGTDVGVEPSKLRRRGRCATGSNSALGTRCVLSVGRASTDLGLDIRGALCGCGLFDLRCSRVTPGDDKGEGGSRVAELLRGPRTADSIEEAESRRLRTGRRTWRRLETRFRAGCNGGSISSGSGCTVDFHKIRSHLRDSNVTDWLY